MTMHDPLRYRGRFAPSPTGPLHIGSLIAALASYCDARHAGGEWRVRIEDVDVPRARAEDEADILQTLERYGFEWDGAVVRQSQRTQLYRDALAHLIAHDDVYPCTCPRRELADLPIGAAGETVYPGTCRARHPNDAEALERFAWRMRVMHAPLIAFIDRLQGPQAQTLAQDVGDFVVQRSDGLFAYQLAVVVDDAAQHITDVVRGADLLASTPRQMFLQRALGLQTPRYLHVPVAVDARGRKLSKQTAATALPAKPLSALHAAWRFLGQRAPPDPACPAPEFWAWAIANWHADHIPATATRPAPPAIV